jgi:tetratricopeptide (TPR) repeat protein
MKTQYLPSLCSRCVVVLLYFFALPVVYGQTQSASDFFNRGYIAYQAGDYEEAIKLYTISIRMGVEPLSYAYNYRGSAKKRMGRYAEALHDYDKAIELQPNYAIAYNNRGYVYFNLQDYAKAIKDWELMELVSPIGYKPHHNYIDEARRKLAWKELKSNDKRFALVVGNNKYKVMGVLANAVYDSKAIATKLRKLDFEVIEVENANKATFQKKIGEFAEKLKNGGTGLFYYAGHGTQFNNKNYLIPTDADTTQISCIGVDDILYAMENREVAVNILILDACRSNARGEKDQKRTFAKPDFDAKGSVIAFSTSPDNIALDGSPDCPRNSVYT